MGHFLSIREADTCQKTRQLLQNLTLKVSTSFLLYFIIFIFIFFLIIPKYMHAMTKYGVMYMLCIY